MSVLSNIRSRVAESLHSAHESAAGLAAKVEEAGTSLATAAKRKVSSEEPPAPSAASLASGAQASADFARNATASLPNKHTSKGPAVFAGFGVSAAAGADHGVGVEASAGYVVGANGDLKEYGSTGTVNGAFGASAGAGFEAGIIFGSADDFYGDGHQISVSAGPATVSLSLTSEKKLSSVSLSAGKSVGAGIFDFDTHTEDRTGR